MTYRRSYRDTQFTAISEVGLTGGSGESFAVGDSFTYSGADATITVRDNDSFLAGDSRRNERGNDYQAGTIETENGTVNAGNVYAESYYVLYGSDGRVYFLAEIEGTGLSNDLSQDDYFTFIGHVPPAGVELTAVAQRNVYGGIRYSSLGAGDVVDTDTPSQAIDDAVSAFEDSDGTDVLPNLLDNDDLGSISSLEVSAVNGDAISVGAFIDLADGGRVLVGSDGSIQFDADGDFEALATGDTEVVSFTYAATDSAGNTTTATAFITVTGTNDDPVVAAGVMVEADEDGAAFSVDLLEGASDVDASDDLSVENVTGLVSGVILVGTSLSVDPTDAAFQSLAEGETQVIVVSYDVVDGNGGSVGQTATITITGTNDAPSVVTALADQSSPENTAVSFALPGSFADADGDALSLSATLLNGDPLPTWLSFDGATFSGTPPQDFNGTLDVTVTASDGVLDVSDTFALEITAVNDAPIVVTALADQSSPEDTAVSFALPGSFADADGDALSLSATLLNGDPLPTWLSFDGATFSGTPPQDFNGTLDVTVTASDGILDVSDTFALEITAVNDAPIVVTALADQSSPEDTAVNFALPGSFTDADGDALAFSATLPNGDPLPAWLNFDGATFSGTPPQDFNGMLDVTVTASDGILDVSDTFALEITTVNDDPVVAAALMATASEDDSGFSLNLLDGASDVDANDSLGITNLTILSGDASGVTLNGTNLDVDPSAYTGLAFGQSEIIEYSYDVEDGNGGSVAQNATITIAGTNNIIGTDQDETLVGDALGNVILGDDGDDILTGNAGDDTLDGGDGIDTVDYSTELGTTGATDVGISGILVDLGGNSFTDPFAQDTFGDRDSLINIENVIATDNNDAIAGNESDNRVELRDGTDRYSYEVDGSNDIADGGSGNDSLFIVNGQRFGQISFTDPSTTATTFDVTVLDSASDTVDSSASAIDTDDILVTASTGGSVTGDAFGRYTFQLGSAGDTVNIVGDFSNTALFGGIGSPTVTGGDGNDVVDASLMSGNTGSSRDVAVLFRSNDGDDTFRSGAGDDFFDAGGGDEINGDTVDFAHATGSVIVNLSNTDNSLVDARDADATAAGLGTDTLLDVENAIGGSADDTIFGSAENNTLDGGGGDDVITGGGGNDRISGGAGDDNFVFEDVAGETTVADFTIDTVENDLLDISAFTFTDLAGLQTVITEDSGDTRIQLDADTSIVLEGVVASTLDDDDFLFV